MNNKLSLLAALALSLAAPLFAQDVVYADRMAPVTLSEMGPWPQAVRERAIRHPSFDFRVEFREVAGQATPPPMFPVIAAPGVKSSFFSSTARDLSPGDAAGAVGPNHIVSALNSGIIVHDRSGKILAEAKLEQFWGEPARRTQFYDPRIIYDKTTDRFVLITIENEEAMRLAVTKTSDPAGEWSRYRLPLRENGDGIDFTRMAVTPNTVLVGTNRVYSNRTAILSLKKTDLYVDLPSMPVTKYDLINDVTPVTSDEPVEFLLRHSGGIIGVYRIDSDNLLMAVTGGYSWQSNQTYAPQLGSSQRLDTGWGTLEHALIRDGILYVVHTIIVEGRSAILWWKVNLESGAVLAVETIQHPTAYYAFPSLAVNKYGAMVIAFTVFSATTHPSSAYVYRDPSGRSSPVTTLSSGTSVIFSSDRWGDYTTTVVDPTDDLGFWTVQMHTHDQAWAAWWSNIVPLSTRRRSARH